MNRNDEFTEFMKELDGGVPEIGESIKRGSRRKARKKFLYQPLMSLAAVFMLFVLSVNLCAPVAKACANIPFLKELTKAVAFSKSLKAALENDYIQEVNLTQTKDGVTVEITSMIVDHQKLTVFYRMESEQYAGLQAYCSVPDDILNNQRYDTLIINDFNKNEGASDGEVQYVVVDFYKKNVTPKKLPFRMDVWNSEAYLKDVQAGVIPRGDDAIGWEEQAEKYAVTSFEFELEPDWTKIPEAETYKVNQTLELDGQKFTVKEIEVYPTYMNINLEGDEENTASLAYLHFYVENEKGERFRDGCVGNCGGGRLDREVTVRAESPYFYEGELSRLVVTGAEWLEPEKERAYINLTTGETRNLPENMTLKGIRKEDGTVYLDFEQKYLLRMDEETGDPFGKKFGIVPPGFYYDEEGNVYYGEVRCDWELDEGGYLAGESGKYEWSIKDYPYEEVWLENLYSSIWLADQEVSLEIK